jgi:hypothetical protein
MVTADMIAVVLAIAWFALFCVALLLWLRLRIRCEALEHELELLGAMYYQNLQGYDEGIYNDPDALERMP